MGKRTVRWNDLKTTPGYSSCDKCDCHGIIQGYDWIYGTTYYYYCDCYYGKIQMEKERGQSKPKD